MVMSKKKGNRYECDIVRLFKELGFEDAITSRAGDRSKDPQGLDVINVGNFGVQTKSYKNWLCPVDEFKKMPDELIKMIFYKLTNKGEFVIMPKKDFLKIFKKHIEV